jgi:hypothetical protein
MDAEGTSNGLAHPESDERESSDADVPRRARVVQKASPLPSMGS